MGITHTLSHSQMERFAAYKNGPPKLDPANPAIYTKQMNDYFTARALGLVKPDSKRRVNKTAKKTPKRNRHIPQRVRREVYRRDGGRCTKCGSNENIEYDHILPFSKGGSHSVDNIRILCMMHNRQKANSI